MADPERIFGPDGAIEAALEAKKAGKIRYIGFTGHKSPEIHLKMLETAEKNDFLFDTVQMPLNIMDAHYDSFQKKVLPVLVEKNIGAIGMKPMCAARVFNSNIVTAEECLHYAMNLPLSVIVTGCNTLEILQQTIDAARSFTPMSDEQRSELLTRTAEAAAGGAFEPYKTGTDFDATSRNPHWLG